jgi:phosphate transport system protein
MSHPFEDKLANIRDTLLMMSSLTDRNFTLAIRALAERDDRLADLVEAEDSEIDRLEISIDDMVIVYMATHGPVACDSRLMLGVSKISNNLERIGDQATTIARRTRALNSEPPLIAPLVHIPAMTRMMQQMLHDAITAFVDGNPELAQTVIPRDKEVDELNRQIGKTLIDLMIQSPENVTRAVAILTITKAIERAADHAKAIAEEVFFLCRGQDIRHEGKSVLAAVTK